MSITLLLCAGLAGLQLGCASLQGARLYTSGTEALDRGDTARAVAELEQAARLLPEASEVHNHLGLAYAQAGRAGEAKAAFERAVALDCDNHAAAYNLQAAEAGRFDAVGPEPEETTREDTMREQTHARGDR